MKWLDDLLREGWIIELFRGDQRQGARSALVSRSGLDSQSHGEGKTIKAAVKAAMENYKEDEDVSNGLSA